MAPMQPSHRARDRRLPTGMLVFLGVVLMILGCMSGEDAGALSDPDGDASEGLHAQAELARHRVDRAQAVYSQLISEYAHPPAYAFAGKAITDLLLLPGSPAASTLLVEHLGATHPVDANALLYADEGLLYWSVRGVSWEDEGSYKGINSLISARMPWSKGRLSGVREFFDGLSQSLNLATADLVELADAMALVQADLERALEDERFDMIYIPGQTFHSEQLDLFLGRSELHLMSSMISAARAGLYFVSAYDFDFSLDDALGSQAWQTLNPQPDWGVEDYAYAFVDGHLLREVRAPERLLQAREALQEGLDSLIMAIQEGAHQDEQTTIRWAQGDGGYGERFVDFLEALRGSLFGPTQLPDSSPASTLDLSSFFEGGRVLEPSTDWFERRVDTDGGVLVPDDEGGLVEVDSTWWVVTEAAAQAFFFDDIFDPPVGPDEDAPEIGALDADAGGAYFDALFGPLVDRANTSF